MVKTIKLAISLIDENKISYKDLCEELFQMQYLSAKVCNRVMSYLYADKQQEFIMKDANMDIPTPKEMYGKSRMAYINDKLKEIMTTSYSGNISQTRSFVENQFSKDVKRDCLRGMYLLLILKELEQSIYITNHINYLKQTRKLPLASVHLKIWKKIRNGCKYMYKLTRKNVSYVTKTSIKKNTVVTSNKSVKTSTAVSTEFPKSVNSNPTTVPDKEVISNGDSTVIIDNTSSVTDNVIHLYVKDISGNYQKIADIPDAGSLALECSVYNAATNTVKIQCGNYSVIANASIDADGFYCIDMKQILNNKTAYYTQQFFIF